MRESDEADIIFGKVLQSCRKACGKSQEVLAFDAGLERVFISMLERGKRRPSLKTLIALSKGLEKPLSELIISFEKQYQTDTGKTLSKN